MKNRVTQMTLQIRSHARDIATPTLIAVIQGLLGLGLFAGHPILPLALAAPQSAQSPQTAPPVQSDRVSVHLFSAESRAGFEDESLARFRKEFGRFGEAHLEFVWMDKNADALVRFMGRGDLTLELSNEGAPPTILWSPDPEDERSWVLLRIGNFAKVFQSRGNTGRSVSRLAKDVAEWLERNRKAIAVKQ